MYGTGDEEIMLQFGKSKRICRYDVRSLKHYDCKGSKFIDEQKVLAKAYGQEIFPNGSWGGKEDSVECCDSK